MTKFIYGTLVTSALGLLLAVPFGVGAAIFLAELAPQKLSDGMTFLIELLAAVPSVIFGLIGIFVMIPALLVIDRAVNSDQGQKYVYVLDDKDEVQYRRVVTGPLQGDGLRVEVASPEDLEHYSHLRLTGAVPEFRVTRKAQAEHETA